VAPKHPAGHRVGTRPAMQSPPLMRSITAPEVKKIQGIEAVPSDSTYGTGDRERCGRSLSGTSRSLTVNCTENIDQEDS
jgi:hypothetical protein